MNDERSRQGMSAGRVVTVRGARATEDRLLADLQALQSPSHQDLRWLGQPVRLLVSSRPLREHLAAVVARRLGGAVLGVKVQTIWTTAREIVGRDAQAHADDALYEVLVRREAAREPALRAALAELRDGYGLVAATVRDFLSANLRVGDGERLLPALAALHREERERVAALVRVAERTARALAQAGACRVGDLLQQAAGALAARGASVLPSRAVLIHGFSDATGQATAFLAALLRECGASIYLDAPPDPAAPDAVDRGVAYGARFRARLLEVAEHDASGRGHHEESAAALHMIEAPGAEIEVREVAYRIRELLDAGLRPEGVHVVTRALERYAVPVRRQFLALGIPFSGGITPTGLAPVQRRGRAALDVVRRAEDVSVDRWLDALGPAVLEEHRDELRLALRALGMARLRELEALDVERVLGGRTSYPLPTRQGLDLRTEGDQETAALLSPRRQLPGIVLQSAVARARALLELRGRWPERATAGQHAACAAALLGEHLGWSDGGRSLLEPLAASLPPSLALHVEEFLLLLERQARSLGSEPLGGAGGGVRVLDVAHARGLTCEQLFVLGMNRDLFPRPVREDPLLSDAARGCLRAGLPDLPLKSAGRDEERFLFAELCSSAPRVTLSWQWCDEDGRPRGPSPLVERLRLGTAAPQVERLPRLWARLLQPPYAGERRPRPVRDSLRLAALAGGRAAFAEVLPAALREPLAGARSAADAAELARARLRVLEEQDPDLATLDGRLRDHLISPYLGFVGPRLETTEPHFVTTLESLARCPWRTFLTRVLRVEALPDPLATLPGIAALPVGTTVHRALARLVAERGGRAPRTLAAALRATPAALPRPDPATVGRIVEQEAAAVADEEGIRLPGLQRVLAIVALPYVERALALDWREDDALAVLGAELQGETTLRDAEGRERRVAFKADRVDGDSEQLRLSDYKTGRPLAAARAATRESHLRQALERGEWLQAAVYAACGAAPAIVGRYVFLRPELSFGAATLSLAHDDSAVRDLLPRVLSCLVDAWDEGVFFPRLEEPGGREPTACRYCRIAEACARGDSGARRRLRRLLGGVARGGALSRREATDSAGHGSLQRAVALWQLGRESTPPEGER
jgi:hypothetical protein